MLSNSEFRQQAHKAVDWIADYLDNIEKFPVKSQILPGSIKAQLPENAPDKGENMEIIFDDFASIIPPGITHWQHPGFMALFPSNHSYESVLAEMLVAGLGINAMVWETSPAATELEERMMEWIGNNFGIPAGWKGVIHDTASTSTLTAIISAREKYSQFKINQHGYNNFNALTLYCSAQTHYSIEKGAKAAGIGLDNVIKIATDENYAMQAAALEKQIQNDLAAGKQPFMVVAALGTTSSLAFDPLSAISAICKKYNLWLHIDAAYAGAAFVLEEYQHYLNGIIDADSYVFNAHKWLFTNFDCSLYFVKDAQLLINTFSSNPDYLKRTMDEVTNFKDWGLPLGRRFRALKLWFMLRSFGIDGIKLQLRKHIALAQHFLAKLLSGTNWELMAPFQMNVLCIRFHPAHIQDNDALNKINENIIQSINATGKFYLSGTRLNGNFVIRVVIGQTHVEKRHVEELVMLLHQVTA
jgi:aromatic-L-amino-acid/L-tryptophan decarboxylase